MLRGLLEEEAAILSEVLISYPSDLRMDVADTDSMEYHEQLKQTEPFLKRLLERLET